MFCKITDIDADTVTPPLTVDERRLGKVSPFWIPDHCASSCMDCDAKFTVIKRRHHCRACGRILCSKCCGMRASLEYLQNQEQRVCQSCFHTLAKGIYGGIKQKGKDCMQFFNFQTNFCFSNDVRTAK